MKHRDILLGLCVVFSSVAIMFPWAVIPATLFAVMVVLENHKLKVKIQVEGEILNKVLELENNLRQIKVTSAPAAVPNPMRGIR